MNKVFVAIILFPFIAILAFKAVAISEYDMKQRYLKDQVDLLTYEVKITGILTIDEYSNFISKINRISDFSKAGSIVLQKGNFSGTGVLTNMQTYTPGEMLSKGEAFFIYIKSSNVSNYSRLQNNGVNPDDSENLYYKAKSLSRVEKVQ